MSLEKIWYERKLESIINWTINSKYPRNWREDSISESLLEALGNFFSNNTYHDELNRITKIHFSAYKLKGKSETNYGDIAFITSIRFDNGLKIKGVANFEAKKRLGNEFKYRKQSRDNQYEKIYENLPHSQLLLYDYEPITQHIQPIKHTAEDWNLIDNYRMIQSRTTNCISLPIYLVANGKNVNRNQTQIGRTLSEQLCRRIFYGNDLNISQDILDKIYNFDDKYNSQFVVDLKITHGNTDIIED